MKKYVLISTNDESMSIEHEVFDNLEDARERMKHEWDWQGGNAEYDDYCNDNDALICNDYVYLWKIIEVS